MLGRDSIGIDADPLSVFVSRVKAHALGGKALGTTASQLEAALGKLKRSDSELEDLAERDLDDAEYARQLDGSSGP